MAQEREVIKEFLASLGYQVDAPSARKFTESLRSATALATGLGKAIAGVAVSAEVMVDAYAFAMEKLYYTSRRTHSSVESLQALSFGARQVGISAETAQGALEAMTSAMRMNPGLRGMADNLLGKKTAGMDQMKVMLELVQRLAKMPHFVGARFAQMFGMDEQTFFMMKDQMPKLLDAEEKRRQMNRDAGIDAGKAAAAAREYANLLGEIWERVKVLGDAISIKLLPYFREFAVWVNKLLVDFAKGGEMSEFSKQLTGLLDALKEFSKSEFGQTVWKGLKDSITAMIEALAGLMALMHGDVAKANELIMKAGGRLLTGDEMAFLQPDQSKGGGVLRPDELMKRGDLGFLHPFLTGAFLPGLSGAPPGIQISQKTEITVHPGGGNDPDAIARSIGREQARVNGDMVRNLTGAVR